MEVIGERRFALRFDEFPQELRAAILPVVTKYGQELYDSVVAKIPKKTGRAASLVQMTVFDNENSVKAILRFKGDYAKVAALNYGSHKSIDVKIHASALNHVYSRIINSEGVEVQAYSRRTNIEAVKFLGSSLEEVGPEFLAALKEAIARAVAANNEANS